MGAARTGLPSLGAVVAASSVDPAALRELCVRLAGLLQLNPAERADSPGRQFRYCIRLHRAGRRLMTWFGDRTGSVIFDSDVCIPAIYQCLPGQPGVWNEAPWMSLTPAEILTLREGTRLAKGRVVIGGGGLMLLDLLQRPTKDLDIVARVQGELWIASEPLPASLVAAVQDVAGALELHHPALAESFQELKDRKLSLIHI